MKKTIYIIAFELISIAAFAQTNWQKGGNINTPPGSQPTIGTAYNAPLIFLTNSTEKMRIAANGNVGSNNV
jgi:uncharacterized protein YdeI (BOF family)